MTDITTPWAAVFPGQGSQSVGMLSDWIASQSTVQHLFQEASDTLGYDMAALVLEGPAERLDQTVYTQPALLTAGVAAWRVLQNSAAYLPPLLLAGHSLGEYTALVASEVLSFQDALQIVQKRAQLMQEAVPAGVGAMAAILGLDDNQMIAKICASVAEGEVVSPVNFNAIGQTVIAGHKEAVLRAIEALKAAGAKRALLLPVSVPSHCALMTQAAESLKRFMTQFTWHTSKIPVVQNVDAAIHATTADIQEALTAQLYSPVRWVETIQHFHSQGILRILECGPGKVLCGLNKRIVPEMTASSVLDLSL